MIRSLSNSDFWRSCALACLMALPALGEITQDHPELCGKPGEYVPLPTNISATSSDLVSNLILRLSRSTVSIRIVGVNRVQQVCPIANGKLVVFGLFEADPSTYAVDLVDGATGADLHSFAARSPAMSPDQHWLALREPYPVHVDVDISEQYMLYDLTKDATGNKIPGVDYRYVPDLGRTVYPATAKHIPFESSGVPAEQVHSFGGDSFHWAADSRSLSFMDRTNAGLVLVLVRIEGEDLTTYVHHLAADVCATAISRADFSPTPKLATQDVRLEFGTECPPLSLRARDFKPAPIEVHKPRKRRPSVLVKQQ